MGTSLGGTAATTYSSSGALRTYQSYDAYGEQRAGGTLLTENQFTGQKLDDTGLYYFRARYYDPQIGHFVSPDTIVPDATSVFDYNRFMYTVGNPLRYSDPTGHCEQTIGDDDYECLNLAQTIYRKYPGMFSRDGLERTRFDYLQRTYAELQANPPKASLTSILAATLESLGSELPVSVSFDENGTPSVKFDNEELRQMILSPLSGCAKGIGGVCGISYGSSVNGYGAGGRASIDIFANSDAEFAILFSPGGGGYTPLPGPTGKVTVTGIPDATMVDLDGVYAQLGGSGAIGAFGGSAEAVFGKADDGHNLHGQTYGYAYTVGASAEVHFTLTYSLLLYSSQ